MLVANPDTIRPGTNSPMPGAIGAIYENSVLEGGSSPPSVTQVVRYDVYICSLTIFDAFKADNI